MLDVLLGLGPGHFGADTAKEHVYKNKHRIII